MCNPRTYNAKLIYLPDVNTQIWNKSMNKHKSYEQTYTITRRWKLIEKIVVPNLGKKGNRY